MGIEGQVVEQGHCGLVGIIGAGAVGLGVPAVKHVISTGEGIGVEGCRLILIHRLVRHGTGTSVTIELDGMGGHWSRRSSSLVKLDGFLCSRRIITETIGAIIILQSIGSCSLYSDTSIA